MLVSNQTGGLFCHHSELQGIYLPLQRHCDELRRRFTGSEVIDKYIADFIDDYLAQVGNIDYIKVDRIRLNDSEEAWVYVDMLPQDIESRRTFLLSGFTETKGILTWPNSD